MAKPKNIKTKKANSDSLARSDSGVAAGAPPSKQIHQNRLEAIADIYNTYVQETSARVRLIDSYLIFLGVLCVLTTFYGILSGGFPQNAFLASVFGCLGSWTLALTLRTRLSPLGSEFPKQLSPERSILDFIWGNVLVWGSAATFIG